MKSTLTVLRNMCIIATLGMSVNTDAQTLTSGFDTNTLSSNSTFSPGTNSSFVEASCRFEYLYDSQYKFWSGGFAYTNVHDSVTQGASNLYGVRAYKGYNNSEYYAAGQDRATIVTTVPGSKINSFYVTNTTYAYKSMAKGDQFAKKFGGPSGNDPDYFKLVINGYHGGLKTDSVEFYLADFRNGDNSKDYILNSWLQVDVSKLGVVDSIMFILRSSDMSGGYNNTPGFFALDQISVTPGNPTGITARKAEGFQTYPNPVNDLLLVTVPSAGKITVIDQLGKVMVERNVEAGSLDIDAQIWPAGVYHVLFINADVSQTMKVIRQ